MIPPWMEKERIFLSLALCVGLLSGAFYWRTHRVPSSAVADIREFSQRETLEFHETHQDLTL